MVLFHCFCYNSHKASERYKRARGLVCATDRKGYKFDVGKIIESSIRCYHKNVKRGIIPHPSTITILCILADVKGKWAEEETCP